MLTPLEVVEKQLTAYNAHDLESFCSCFCEDVEVELLIGNEVLFRGAAALHRTYAERFSHPNLKARLLNRIAVGQVVVDEEEITGLPDRQKLYVLAIYEIEKGLIKKVRFERTN